MRTGPSTDHPIRWVYTRTGLPVRIVEESELWRRIEDPDGETGWAHSSLLSIQRTVMVAGRGIQELRRSAAADGRVVARARARRDRRVDRLRGRLVPDRGRGRARLAAAASGDLGASAAGEN